MIHIAMNSTSDIVNIIKGRRNTKRFTNRDVSDKEVSILLDSAVWAPNHRNTEPWRFFVIRKNSPLRAEIAKELIDNQEKASGNYLSDIYKQRINDEVQGYPPFIFVYSLIDEIEEITEENYGAVCCSVQNMQLVATSMGLSVGWSTGKMTRLNNLHRLLEITEKLKTVGVLTIGEPQWSINKGRTSYEEFTKWF